MTRARLVALVAAAALGTGATQAAAATDAPRLSPLTVRFPERSYVLTLPDDRSLVAADVTVLENGKDVSAPSVRPADRRGAFGIVLVIDASNSMRGEPIEAAIEAAQAFAGRRRADQPLGIVTFNARTTTLLPLTTDQRAIDAALAAPPPLALKTGIRDATLAALAMLRDARVTGGSVVVLSDGEDTASASSTATVLAAAGRANARIFTVGIDSDGYEAATLEALAERTGGAYSLASSPRQLEEVFERLGAQLGNQYVVRYRSFAKPRERVAVEVRVRGASGDAHAAYTAPDLAVPPPRPFRRSAIDRLVGSPATAAAVALACALLLGATLLLLLRIRSGRLLERIGRFVPPSVADDDQPAAGPRRRTRAALAARLPRAGLGWWQRFEEDLDVGRVGVGAGRLALMSVAGGVVTGWLFATLSGAGPAALLALLVPVGARLFAHFRAARVRRAFGDQLAENVQVVASAMRAGHSFSGALSVVVEEAAEPTRHEFRRIVNDERLGMPIEQSFDVAARRMQSDELDHVGLVARLQSQSGGNTAEVLDGLVETLRARNELLRLVRTLTAQGRMAMYVIGVLPFVLLGAMTLVSRDYADKIWTTTSGHVMLAISAFFLASGLFVIRRIVDIKV